jgi:hypothetical protein
VLGGCRKNAANLRAAFLQAPDEVERFIRGNAAADDEEDTPAAGCGGMRALSCRLFAWRWPAMRRVRRINEVERFAAGFVGGLAQDDADFILHRAAVARRPQANEPFQFIVELPDGKTGQGASSMAVPQGNQILAG